MNYEWVAHVLGFVAVFIVKKLAENKPVNPKKKISVSTSSSSSSGCNYEVFLSFRGADTRNGFTDHLYKALKDRGIHTFRDDEELRTGEEIGPDLLAAIQQSTIAIPVFSEGYASSKWCLIEIAMIAECKKKGQIVLPIFYRVEPSEVRNQTGRYAEDFRKHEKRFDDETVKKWREALADVGKLKGWDLDNNGKEANLISLVVETVLRKLKNSSLIVSDNLVGIDSHIEEMIRLLYTESKQIVGIHGIGGIGKTTIAKATFNNICSQFDGCSFLADIRRTCQQPRDFVFLQNKLISDILNRKEQSINDVDEGIKVIRKRFSNKRILLVVDDVDRIGQLDALAGKCEWFGLGSRIIITTRDKHILNLYGVDGIYEPKEMDLNQSIQLLSKHAFRKDQPPEDYVDISQKVAQTTGGLPLALEVLGSFLFLKPKSVWIETLKKLKKKPDAEFQDKLRISYDGLDD